MAKTRSAAKLAADEEQQVKRCKMQENARPFEEINDDCLLKILSHLNTDDLNSIAMCSRRCRDMRNNDSLDQTRTGTIDCSSVSVISSLYLAIIKNDWNAVFSGNRSKLKIIGPGGLVSFMGLGVAEQAQLAGVTALDMSFNSDTPNRQVPDENIIAALSHTFPNLREIDLSYFKSWPGKVMHHFAWRCRNLSKLIWNGNSTHLQPLSGGHFTVCSQLTELHIDGAVFEETLAEPMSVEQDSDLDDCFYMFDMAQRIERLSIKDCVLEDDQLDPFATIPLPQALLVKMVRNHPSLTWLRSDLSAENVAMLQRERPDITFVTE